MTADIFWFIASVFVGAVCGTFLGYGWGWHDGYRKAHQWIERASGMYDPVCTCAYAPEKCLYHVIESKWDEIKKARGRTD